jgi:hypothetical protein
VTTPRSLAARRLALTVFWTGTLAAGLYGLDRSVFGVPRTGWQVAITLDAIPRDAGAVSTPRYIPESLSWPPREMHYRAGDAPGFWLGLTERNARAPRLWIGTGEPLPDAVSALAGCVTPTSDRRCPKGWHTQSFQAGARVIYVMADLDPTELRRVMHGLAEHPSDPAR